MAKLTVVFGVLLVLLSAGAFAFVSHFPHTLIPGAFGIVLIVLGALARTPDQKRRMLFMHIAVTVGLLGFLGQGGNGHGGDEEAGAKQTAGKLFHDISMSLAPTVPRRRVRRARRRRGARDDPKLVYLPTTRQGHGGIGPRCASPAAGAGAATGRRRTRARGQG